MTNCPCHLKEWILCSVILCKENKEKSVTSGETNHAHGDISRPDRHTDHKAVSPFHPVIVCQEGGGRGRQGEAVTSQACSKESSSSEFSFTAGDLDAYHQDCCL